LSSINNSSDGVNLTGIWPEYCCNNYSKISEDYHTEYGTQIAPEPVKIEIKTGQLKSTDL